MSNRRLAWTKDRLEELVALEQLLRVMAGMNNGSGVIQNMQYCIKCASTLTFTDLIIPRQSFLEFLKEKCIVEQEQGKVDADK